MPDIIIINLKWSFIDTYYVGLFTFTEFQSYFDS